MDGGAHLGAATADVEDAAAQDLGAANRPPDETI